LETVQRDWGDLASMVTRLIYDTQSKRIGPLLRGHLLLYERRDAPTYAAWSGVLLLLIVLVLEFLIGPRMESLAALDLQLPSSALRTLILLALALVLVRLVARVRLNDVGFISFGQWRAAETLYLAQALLIGCGLFVFMFGARLGLSGGAGAWLAVGGHVLTQMLWGLYQEVVYRGLLQTELSRRFGAIAGALAANLAFTFGPLHLYHLQNSTDTAQTTIMMAAIFGIGLLFAFIFARCRNIWLIGLLHGLGNVFGNVGSLAASG